VRHLEHLDWASGAWHTAQQEVEAAMDRRGLNLWLGEGEK